MYVYIYIYIYCSFAFLLSSPAARRSSSQTNLNLTSCVSWYNPGCFGPVTDSGLGRKAEDAQGTPTQWYTMKKSPSEAKWRGQID